jgi:hypothetical protein
MTVRIPFNGGSFELREAGEFADKTTGKPVKLEPAVAILGVKNKAVRLPIDVVDAIGDLVKKDEYKAFRAK